MTILSPLADAHQQRPHFHNTLQMQHQHQLQQLFLAQQQFAHQQQQQQQMQHYQQPKQEAPAPVQHARGPSYSLFGGDYPLKPLCLSSILSPPHPVPQKRPSLVATTASGAVLPPPGFQARLSPTEADEHQRRVEAAIEERLASLSIALPRGTSPTESCGSSGASTPTSGGDSGSSASSSCHSSRKSSFCGDSDRSSPVSFSIRILDQPQQMNASLTHLQASPVAPTPSPPIGQLSIRTLTPALSRDHSSNHSNKRAQPRPRRASRQ